MVKNNLYMVEKNLRSIAKRYKGVKYSLGLAILFLMMGLSAFSQDVMSTEEIAASKENLRSSVGTLQNKVEAARKENQKAIDGLKLELIQLMEQGDQVVKSPWASWQFGANYMYNDWRGTYKGRGDKSKEKLNLTRKTDPLERFKASSVMSTSYGTTSLDLVYEPPKEVEVSAGIRPKEVNKQAPTFVPPEPSGSLPPFTPKIITPPERPVVNTFTPNQPDPLLFPGTGANPNTPKYSYWNTTEVNSNEGNISETSVESGEVLKKYTKLVSSSTNPYVVTVTSKISLKDYHSGNGLLAATSTATYDKTEGSGAPLNGTDISENLPFFMTLLQAPYSYFGENSKIAILSPDDSGNHKGTVINLETQGSPNKTFQDLKDSGKIDDSVLSDLNTYATSTSLNNSTNGQLYHVNKGIVEIGGNGARYVQTTYDQGNNRVNVVENRKKIISMNYNENGKYTTTQNIIFYHSPDSIATGAQHIYVNATGAEISSYGEKGVVALYTSFNTTSNYLSQGDVSFINNGTVNLYGRSSTGVAINKDTYGKLTAPSSFILNNPINIYGDDSVGLYVLNSGDGVKNDKNQAKFVIGDKSIKGLTYTPSNSLIEKDNVKPANSNKTGGDEDLTEGAVGIYVDNPSAELKIKLPQLDIEKYAKGAVGVFVNSGKATITSGNIKINGGTSNVGLYAKGGNIDYTGDITMGGSALTTVGGDEAGSGNIGLYATNGKKIDLRGKLKTYNNNGAVKDGTGIYADNSDINVTQAVDMKFEAGTTGQNVGIYSKGPGGGAVGKTVTISGDGSKINIDGGTTNKGTALFSGDGGKIVADSTATNVGLQITVTKGAAAIASDGTNSNVSAKFANIDYSGEGYALYTANNGKIDVSGSKISLRGNATGFERDVAVATSPITLTGATITAYSNNVTIMNLRNVPALNLTTLSTDLSTYTGGVTHSAGTDPVTGEVYNKYKTAAVDGLSAYNINTDLDKSIATDDANASTNDYVFTRRMAVQRGIINLKPGKNVKAVLSTADLSKIGDASVVGLSMNSSSYATSNAEAGINLEANTTVTADRTTAGNGAVGLYINYGKVNTDASSTINVEKETSNSANDSAVGIYSVNGSEVTSAGKVNVGGQNSIGILGVAYRIDSATNNPIVNEFGTAAVGQGQTNILNKGEVTLDGANATGIYVKNNNSTATRATAIGTNDTTGVITLSGDSSTGMSGDKATLENKGTININGQKSVGMFAKNSSDLKNSGTINLADGLSENEPNIGMYTNDDDTKITNDKDIIGGNNTYGIYGKKVDLTGNGKIKVGDSSVGIYSNEQHPAGLAASTVYLQAGTKIEVGNNQSVGVFTTGTNQIITGDADMQIGDSSYGYVIKGTGTKLHTNVASGVTLGDDAVYVYSSDTTGNITNNTELTATGSKNYGIYAAGTVTNLANMNFGTGVGNVGMYSIGGGTLTNGSTTVSPTITVSGSDTVNKLYGIGMAAGYVNDAGTLVSTGNIVNYGTIKVEKDNGIGMFATGSGSTATNRGTIELSGKKTTGMYLDNNAIGYNYGTITTVPNPTNDGIVGVVASNGAIIKNYGTINIVDGTNLTGVFINKGTKENNYDDQIPGGGTGVLNGPIDVKKQSATGKTVAGINIVAPGDGTATIYRDGTRVTPIAVDTVTATPKPISVNVGTTSLDLSATDLATPSLGQASSIGMYVDTSGVNYTNPIQGLNLLTGLQKVDLIFGTEASKYTNEKDIEVGQNILKPYNDVITSLSGGSSMKFSFTSGSLTWIATATQNTDDTLKALYLSKIPYTAFAKDKNTGNFLDGLEQRYGVEGLGTREKALFDKLNGIGKGEAALFAQAVDEMKGHQYSNVQQRIQATGNILDREFDYLKGSWSNPSKDSNKIKTFGARGEYNTDTAGVIDYRSHAYGVAYVHEDESVRLGESVGWYAGVVENKLKFKDLGNSKEDQLQGKVGIFKSVPFDYNNSLNWTISGDIFVGYNKMNRRFLVVDDIFGAKSRYYTYGLGVKNEISKSFRLSEGFSFVPHAGLNLEYGRFSKIREKSGEMRLEVKGNDYFSIRPEVGADLAYKYSFGNNNLKVSVGVAYENELGKVANANNKARVAYTTADWYDLRGEKEDRRGNVKTDLNIGWDNQRVGVTANVGYDTKGENVRGGVGLRVIF